MKSPAIGIIGLGHMGEAVLKGAAAVPQAVIFGVESDAARRRRLRRRYEFTAGRIETVGRECGVIVLCVKPQDAASVLTLLAAAPRRRPAIVISVAAGLTARYIEKFFSGPVPVVRVMPNMPGLIGQGISAFSRGTNCGTSAVQWTKRLFATLGPTMEVPESLMDAITAVSGSGPGFFAQILDSFVQAACSLGISRQQAELLSVHTMAGTAAILRQLRLSPQELAQRVASKGGTTEAGLRVLRSADLTSVFTTTVRAAAARAQELNRE